MKKLPLLLISYLLGLCSLQANPVTPVVAKTAATNFYQQKFYSVTPNLTLVYTERDDVGLPVYYAFNVNSNDGFVIISAEDATRPIIGYSDKGQYIIPAVNNNIGYWMQTRKKMIIAIRAQQVKATADITAEWNTYSNNITYRNPHNAMSVVLPLCQTTWDQPWPYNAMCPGGSVTGCVATAMAQIMRYWSYPPHGLSQSCYDDVNPPFTDNWGLLCDQYDTVNYNWSAMPLGSVVSTNYEVAKLMYDCGVSVDMDYTPTGSGAQVIGGNPSAQYSYVTYFGYNPSTISGVLESSYSASAWTNLIENELNNSRLVQYAGFDNTYGGHTWVCDGYDASNNFHMNWGWSGTDDGYYAPAALNPSPYDFVNNEQACIGIEPPPVLAEFTASPTSGCGPLTAHFTDQSLIPSPASPITTWAWTFTGGTPSTSGLKNPTVTYNTPGNYAVVLKVTNNQGTNTMTKTSYITVNGNNTLPLSQSFEGSWPPSQWSINNPNGHSTTWDKYSGVGGFGNSAHCMYYNNCSGGIVGNYDQVYTPIYDFSGSTKPVIYFDVAYAPYDVSTSPPESDTLVVYYSLDCGKTFTQVYMKGGMTLCTTGKSVVNGANANGSGCFIPLAANWRTDTIHIPAIAGNSSVLFSFENRSGNGTNMFIDNINVPTAPVAAFTVNDSNICIGTIDSVQFIDHSVNSPNHWNWTFAGGTPSTSILQNPWVKYTTSGLYTGKLKTSNGQGSDSLTKTNYVDVKVCTGIQNEAANSIISIYPNPAKDEFTIQISGSAKASLVELYTVTGQQVINYIPSAGQSFIINTKSISNGVYLLKLHTQDGSTLVKRVEIIK